MKLIDYLKISFMLFLTLILVSLPIALALCFGILISPWFTFFILLYFITIPIIFWLWGDE